jgi:hypothetical protein
MVACAFLDRVYGSFVPRLSLLHSTHLHSPPHFSLLFPLSFIYTLLDSWSHIFIRRQRLSLLSDLIVSLLRVGASPFWSCQSSLGSWSCTNVMGSSRFKYASRTKLTQPRLKQELSDPNDFALLLSTIRLETSSSTAYKSRWSRCFKILLFQQTTTYQRSLFANTRTATPNHTPSTTRRVFGTNQSPHNSLRRCGWLREWTRAPSQHPLTPTDSIHKQKYHETRERGIFYFWIRDKRFQTIIHKHIDH